MTRAQQHNHLRQSCLFLQMDLPSRAFPFDLPLGAKYKAKPHILAEPHDVVGPPGVVEEVAMNSSGEIRLAVRERQGRLYHPA